MSTKCLLALALVAALVALASPYYLDEDIEEEGGAGPNQMEAEAMQYLLQKRGRGRAFNRCVNPETGRVCKCANSRSRSFVFNRECEK